MKDNLNAAKQEEKIQPIYNQYTDLNDLTGNSFKKTIYAVIGPIEEGSVETSISHGVMSDSTLAIDTQRSDSPQQQNILSLSQQQQSQQPQGIIKKERSFNDDIDSPIERTPSREKIMVDNKPSQELNPQEVRFSDNIQQINTSNNLSTSSSLSKQKNQKSPRKRRNSKNYTRINTAAENIKKMYVIANTAAGKV